jgi:hypothetical protein
VPTRRPRRGRPWQLHLVVLLQSTRWCTPTAPLTTTTTSISTIIISSSGLPAHLSISTPPPPPPTARATSGHVCFNYGQTSHFACDCTAPKKNNTQGHQKVAIAKTGRINYTTMEDISKGEQVLMGTFSLNGYHVVILFDFGATHDFISKACTQKCQLVIEHMHTPYMISTPGGKVFTKQVVVNSSLNLKGYRWSPHCDRGRRESESNPCKQLDCPISSEELHRQEVPSPRI